MNITVTVMAHPKRKDAARLLLAELRQYPFVEASIVWDQKDSEWDTGSRAIRAGVGMGQWHLVLQDDGVLTPNFYENVEGAIRNVPVKTLISLYTGQARPLGKRVKAAVDKAKHASWLRHYILTWGVGILIPTDHIEPMLEFVSNKQYDNTPYDVRIGMFYQRNMLPVFYTMPSLVDHNEGLGSLLDHDKTATEARVAHRLATGPIRFNNKVVDI